VKPLLILTTRNVWTDQIPDAGASRIGRGGAAYAFDVDPILDDVNLSAGKAVALRQAAGAERTHSRHLVDELVEERVRQPPARSDVG
jgi:hypothetical protein